MTSLVILSLCCLCLKRPADGVGELANPCVNLPCNIRRGRGQSLVIAGSSLVILEGKACNPLQSLSSQAQRAAGAGAHAGERGGADARARRWRAQTPEGWTFPVIRTGRGVRCSRGSILEGGPGVWQRSAPQRAGSARQMSPPARQTSPTLGNRHFPGSPPEYAIYISAQVPVLCGWIERIPRGGPGKMTVWKPGYAASAFAWRSSPAAAPCAPGCASLRCSSCRTSSAAWRFSLQCWPPRRAFASARAAHNPRLGSCNAHS